MDPSKNWDFPACSPQTREAKHYSGLQTWAHCLCRLVIACWWLPLPDDGNDRGPSCAWSFSIMMGQSLAKLSVPEHLYMASGPVGQFALRWTGEWPYWDRCTYASEPEMSINLSLACFVYHTVQVVSVYLLYVPFLWMYLIWWTGVIYYCFSLSKLILMILVLVMIFILPTGTWLSSSLFFFTLGKDKVGFVYHHLCPTC